MKKILVCVILISLCFVGYKFYESEFLKSKDFETSAKEFYEKEFNKWVSGQENKAAPFLANMYSPPISFNIRSIFPSTPSSLPIPVEELVNIQDIYKSWPSYQLNVVLEFKSKAGTPLEKIVSYEMIWNPQKENWYIKADTGWNN